MRNTTLHYANTIPPRGTPFSGSVIEAWSRKYNIEFVLGYQIVCAAGITLSLCVKDLYVQSSPSGPSL